jgi:hypothetical protein
MNRFLAILVPLLRGAALSLLLAGVGDALMIALGGGADLRAFAFGAVLLALATGAVHEGAGNPPIQASYLWLGLAAALPMFSGLAPLSAIGGLLFLLPLRALGARLSGLFAVSEQPARLAGLHGAGAAIALAWAAAHGLGLSGFLLAFAAAGLLIVRAPTPAVGAEGDGFERAPRLELRVARFGLGAGLAWLFLLLAPAARAFDSSHAGNDALALLTCAACAALGWLTFGALVADSRHADIWAALATAATGLVAAFVARTIEDLSQPLAFDARLRAGLLQTLFHPDAPRLPEEHPAYVPWVMLITVALPVVLAAIALRGTLGRKPTGPDDLAPVLAGAGVALVTFSLPFAAVAGTAPWIGTAALAALLGAALCELAARPGSRWLRASAGLAIVAAAAAWARPFAPPQLGFPVQDAREWTIARAADGSALAITARDAMVRIVEHPGASPEQFLARGRNLLTPELDIAGTWTRDVDLALQCVPGARRVLLAGAAHPASLRVLARAGVSAAVVAGDPAEFELLRRRDPAGYGLALGLAPSLARARGEFDLVLMRSSAQWDEEVSLLRAWVATQALHQAGEAGACVLALDPEQCVPGILPALLATWRRVFVAVHLMVEPDGLRGVRLLLVGFGTARELPEELAPLAVPSAWVARAANAGSVSRLLAPLPRVHADLATTAWRLVDELRAERRAGAVLAELAGFADGDATPTLLHAMVLQLAVQEYSTHDTYLQQSAEAIEVSREALEWLARWARAWPHSAWVRANWADVGATLAAKREVGLVEEYIGPLREELGWREAGITLPLARAALELLDPERARALLEEVLTADPANAEAADLLHVLEGEKALAPDAHEGHGHD